MSEVPIPTPPSGGSARAERAATPTPLHGHLAHKKTPPPPRTTKAPQAWSWEEALSYERGIPVPRSQGGAPP